MIGEGQEYSQENHSIAAAAVPPGPDSRLPYLLDVRGVLGHLRR